MRQRNWWIIGVLLLSVAGGVWYWQQQSIPEPSETPSDEDITREQTEAHMRQIGYVQ